jgi:hypothetical protein
LSSSLRFSSVKPKLWVDLIDMFDAVDGERYATYKQGTRCTPEASMSLKQAILWGVALFGFLAVARWFGPEQGRELQGLLSLLIVVGFVGWRIWKQ